ncbi:MAG: hypothetical protein HQL10_07125 [Nitrospirae bacterium]|nr:hypothetical protein [Nitrospirota bacterium]
MKNRVALSLHLILALLLIVPMGCASILPKEASAKKEVKYPLQVIQEILNENKKVVIAVVVENISNIFLTRDA